MYRKENILTVFYTTYTVLHIHISNAIFKMWSKYKYMFKQTNQTLILLVYYDIIRNKTHEKNR